VELRNAQEPREKTGNNRINALKRLSFIMKGSIVN
jgi:hypothetical protein